MIIEGHTSIPDTSISLGASGVINDIAIVSKIPGPNGTEQFLFFSKHEMGTNGTINYFTNRDSLESFSDRHLKQYESFTGVFKASGKERTGFSLKEIAGIGF